MTTEAYPLSWPTGWPRAKSRRRAQFGKGELHNPTGQPGMGWRGKRDLTVAEAVKRVLTELERLDVPRGDAIVSTNVSLRLDGLPYSNQREPSDPGVAVYWRARGQKATKVMAIDQYDRVADNLAAIAATLNAMRAIQRHGGAQILERAFTGFTALPAQKSCWEVLGLKPGASREEVDGAFRNLAKRHHPDAGGDANAFHEIQRAREQALGS